jgi:hypothetical protein
MNLDPAMIQAILGSGDADPQADILKRQQMQANMMRAASLRDRPQGQMAGRVFSPDIGGTIQDAVAGYQANKMQPGIDAGTTAMAGRNVNAKKGYLDAMMMAMRRQVPPPPQPVLPPDGMEDQ